MTRQKSTRLRGILDREWSFGRRIFVLVTDCQSMFAVDEVIAIQQKVMIPEKRRLREISVHKVSATRRWNHETAVRKLELHQADGYRTNVRQWARHRGSACYLNAGSLIRREIRVLRCGSR